MTQSLGAKNTFSKTSKQHHADDIFLVRARDDEGKSTWYYLMVDQEKRDLFRRMNGVESITLTDFGKVLFSGYGPQPPASIKKIMLEEYGFQEN